jgi:hypothetical protein
MISLLVFSVYQRHTRIVVFVDTDTCIILPVLYLIV